jgi:ABC-2 type transport system permease protein
VKYIFLIAGREFSENARKKGFWIGLLIMPAILFLSIQVPVWLETKASPIRRFILVDNSGTLAAPIETHLEELHQRRVLDSLRDYASIYSKAPSGTGTGSETRPDSLEEFRPENKAALKNFISQGGRETFLKRLRPRLRDGAPEFQEPRRSFERVALPDGIGDTRDLQSLSSSLKPYLQGEKKISKDGRTFELSAAILIPSGLTQQIVRANNRSAAREKAQGIEFWARNLADTKLRDEIERAVNSEIRRREYQERGLDAAAIREVEQTFVPFASLDPGKTAGKESVSSLDVIKQRVPSGFVYLLWLAIFVIIQMLLNNIIEEKSNRILEVLLSSVTPGELMMGKLCGIAAIGLTMVGVWIAALFGILMWKAGGPSDFAGQLLTLLKTSNLLPLFSIYFFFGYILYAALILALGSVCNTIKEAQSYMGVITMTMMVPLLTMMYIPKDPNGTLARVLSWIPIYTPFTMMNRANAHPPLVDLIGTLLLLIVSTPIALWMAVKIFRIGILRTGQPPKILEMLRWIRRGDL